MFMCSNLLNPAQHCSTCSTRDLLELAKPYSILLKNAMLTCKIVNVSNASRVPEYPVG